MKNSTIPTFYKYFSINQNLYNSLINNELYFSNPRNFNDPFDSNPRFGISNNKDNVIRIFNFLKEYVNEKSDEIKNLKEYIQYEKSCTMLIEASINHIKALDYFYEIESRDTAYRLIETYIFYNYPNIFEKCYKLNPKEFQVKMFQNLIFLLIDLDEYGISCGSITPTCPVMWGHYGYNHKGVCFEFKILDENNINQFCLSEEESVQVSKVKYLNMPLNIFDSVEFDKENFAESILNTKSSKWNYEKEIRLISKNQGLIKFQQKCLTKVIFGYKTDAKIRYSLIRLLANLGYDFEFLIAKAEPDSYEMNIETMTLKDIAGSGVHLSELNIEIPKFLKDLM